MGELNFALVSSDEHGGRLLLRLGTQPRYRRKGNRRHLDLHQHRHDHAVCQWYRGRVRIDASLVLDFANPPAACSTAWWRAACWWDQQFPDGEYKATGYCTYRDADGDMIFASDEEAASSMTEPGKETGRSSARPASMPASRVNTPSPTSTSAILRGTTSSAGWAGSPAATRSRSRRKTVSGQFAWTWRIGLESFS